MIITYFPIFVSLFTIAFVFFLILKIKKAPVAKDKAIEITKAIQEGAVAYLKRQYKTVSIIAFILFLALWIFMGWKMAFGFLIGAFLSGLSGFIGMWVSTQTITRVAEGAKRAEPFGAEGTTIPSCEVLKNEVPSAPQEMKLATMDEVLQYSAPFVPDVARQKFEDGLRKLYNL